MDTFDYQSEEPSAHKSIITRAIIGLHDANAWENSKKNAQDTPTSVSPTAANNMAQSNQSILAQNVQTQACIPRLNCVTASIKPDYFCQNLNEQVKLGSKVTVFDINLNSIRNDTSQHKSSVYETLKLDYRDEAINKFTLHAHYLFSDCVLTSRNYLLTFSDRFLTKFTIPENEWKKSVSLFTKAFLNVKMINKYGLCLFLDFLRVFLIIFIFLKAKSLEVLIT